MKTLNNICHLIVDCPHSTAPDEGAGFPLVRTPNIGQGFFVLDSVHRVSKETYDKRNARAVPQDNDLILAREAPAGNVAIIQNGVKVCLGQRTVLIRPNTDIVYPLWLNYYLNAPEQRHAFLKNANGATVSHVNMPIIRNLPVSLPDMKTQKRIADILSAYDKLIDNNRKQIKLLEEAAQRLYKEWFIDLKFPGHETTPIDPTTNLPEWWERKRFSDLVTIMSGGTPSTKNKDYYGGAIPFFAPGDCGSSFLCFTTAKTISELGLNNCNSPLYPAGTTFITARGTVGNVVYLAVDMAMNQSCFALKSAHFASEIFLFFATRQVSDALQGIANGGVFDSIVLKSFERCEFLDPPCGLIKMFTEIVSPLFKQLNVLGIELLELKEARDRLLPKLCQAKSRCKDDRTQEYDRATRRTAKGRDHSLSIRRR